MWLIQKNFYSDGSLKALLKALSSQKVEYRFIGLTDIKNFSVPPECSTDVIVSGAVSMKEYSDRYKFNPGSFMNGNFSTDIWIDKLGDKMLNSNAVICRLSDISIPEEELRFIRPIADTKHFTGGLFSKSMVETLKARPSVSGISVAVSQPKEIYSEYRVFIVNNKVVTSSLYRLSGKSFKSKTVPASILEFAEQVSNTWLPAETCVVDIAHSQDGLKIIEFNNFNGSAFYECDVTEIVKELKTKYNI